MCRFNSFSIIRYIKLIKCCPLSNRREEDNELWGWSWKRAMNRSVETISSLAKRHEGWWWWERDWKERWKWRRERDKLNRRVQNHKDIPVLQTQREGDICLVLRFSDCSKEKSQWMSPSSIPLLVVCHHVFSSLWTLFSSCIVSSCVGRKKRESQESLREWLLDKVLPKRNRSLKRITVTVTVA